MVEDSPDDAEYYIDTRPNSITPMKMYKVKSCSECPHDNDSTDEQYYSCDICTLRYKFKKESLPEYSYGDYIGQAGH